MIMQTVKTSGTSETETTSTKLHPLSGRIVKWYMNLPVDAKLAIVLFEEMLRAERQMPDRYLADDIRSKLSNQMKDETISEDRGEVALMHGLFLMMQGWET
jgi:hypothetical protein